MSTERPDDFDDTPVLRPLPSTSGDDGLRDDYRDSRPTVPRRKPRFGFWMAVAWALLYFAITQLVAGVVFGILIFGIALVPEVQQNGWGVLGDPVKLKAWMEGPAGRVATLSVVAATQFSGLLLSWLLLRSWCGKQWKRKIALTRGPSPT